MKMCKLVFKKVFIIISCMCLFFSASMSVLADSGYRLAAIYSFANNSRVPIEPVSTAGASAQSGGAFTYSGEFTLDFQIATATTVPLSFDGYFSIQNNFTVSFYPLILNREVYNSVVVSLKEAYLYDANGDSYPVLQSTGFYYSNAVYSASSYAQTCKSQTISPVLFFTGSGIPIVESCIVRATYSVQSQCPLVFATCLSSSLSGGVSQYTLTPMSSSPSTSSQLDQVNKNLDSLGSKTDVTNNKLDNLTSGFDQSGIDSTNHQLGNNLDSFDQAEDAAIDSVKDYFNDIDQPIDFFNVGSFLTSNTFIWTYLQGLYEHLGDAKIVVNVVLALTVAFSFIGLGRYIWKAFDREDSS